MERLKPISFEMKDTSIKTSYKEYTYHAEKKMERGLISQVKEHLTVINTLICVFKAMDMFISKIVHGTLH